MLPTELMAVTAVVADGLQGPNVGLVVDHMRGYLLSTMPLQEHKTPRLPDLNLSIRCLDIPFVPLPKRDESRSDVPPMIAFIVPSLEVGRSTAFNPS